MNKSVRLHVPSYDELTYREKLLADPSTMDYNRGYNLDSDGYDKATGCIAFPQEEWRDWYDYFIGNEPERFYAYIVREADGVFIGEVNLHKSGKVYDMGIVIEGQYRGKGYAEEALRQLVKYAFENINAKAVRNRFEETRFAAIKTHLAAGFKMVKQEDGMCEFLITEEDYFSNK